jgi:hypothetical protein
VGTILVADIIVHIVSVARKEIKVTTPIQQQLDEILVTVHATNAEQKEQRSDMAMLFELMKAVLVGSQLEAKSLTNHKFNGDLEDATDIINGAIDKRNKYVDKKAFRVEV